jgi:hypothetical protein
MLEEHKANEQGRNELFGQFLVEAMEPPCGKASMPLRERLRMCEA